ncbi:MAG: T9SS type A sorting domain-containing protein [Prolixibacteraceae bacterium]
MKKTLLFIAAIAVMGQLSFAQTELIQNGDFSLPDDAVKYTVLTEVEGWTSDDETDNNNGREYRDDNPVAYMHNIAGSMYQVTGEVVPASGATYDISLLGLVSWNGSAGDEVTLTVKISAFAGDDPMSREIIDSINFILTDPQGEWNEFEDVLEIEAGSPYAGQNLVIEVVVTASLVNPTDDNIWVNIDDVSVYQTVQTSVEVVAANQLNVFPVPATNSLQITSAAKIVNINLVDISGRIVSSSIHFNNKVNLDITDLKKGFYLLNATLENGDKVVKRIMKN